jgi:hypothetical protein
MPHSPQRVVAVLSCRRDFVGSVPTIERCAGTSALLLKNALPPPTTIGSWVGAARLGYHVAPAGGRRMSSQKSGVSLHLFQQRADSSQLPVNERRIVIPLPRAACDRCEDCDSSGAAQITGVFALREGRGQDACRRWQPRQTESVGPCK